jgi:hypothetical protein
MRERKADGFTNTLNELALVGVARRKSGWFHQQASSPLLVLREGKADGFTNKLNERWTLLTLALVGVARRKSGWLHQQA